MASSELGVGSFEHGDAQPVAVAGALAVASSRHAADDQAFIDALADDE